jgi:hypothetical protein
VVRRVFVACAVLAPVVIQTATPEGVAASLHRVPVRVTPAAGSPHTTFVLGFRAPERTGRYGSIQRHDTLTAAAQTPSRGCLATVNVRVPDTRAGAQVRVPLVPARLGGHWCAGTYRGRIQELQTPVCPPGLACPAFILLRGVVGRFSLSVRGGQPAPTSGDTTPPSFTGLTRAFACTPGPQRPGQTTPYNLSWQAASDDVTPGSRIVYDVYLGSAPGREDFSKPTWTTPAGVTSYATPGLPSHGSYYFVVRARDGAGNRDANRVEVHGVDPCY